MPGLYADEEKGCTPLAEPLQDAEVPEAEKAAHPVAMEQADADEEDVEDGELARRKVVPDTPLHMGAFHIFKGNVGIGVFLLPLFYNDTGYVLSPLVAVIIGAVVVDSMLMLLHAKKTVNRSKVQTFPDVSDFIFGSIMRVVVNAAVVMVQFAFCMVYLQSAATIFSQIAPFDGAYKAFVALELLIVMPLCFLSHNLKLLGVSSAIATFLVWFTLAGTVVFFVKELHANGGAASTTTPWGEPKKWPLFLAQNLVVLEGIAVVLPVENATGDAVKAKVPMMVRLTMSSIIGLYLFYGMLGYMAYGCALKNTSVTVLPTSAIGDVLRVGLGFNLLLTFPLQFVPAIQIIDKALKIPVERTSGKSKKAVLTRVGINLLLAALAMLLGGDTLALISGFVGATAAVFLAMILPAMLALHVDYAVTHDGPREGSAYYKAMLTLQPNPLRRVKCFAYIILGLAIFAIGTATVLIDTASLVNRKTHTGVAPAPTPASNSSASMAPASAGARCDL